MSVCRVSIKIYIKRDAYPYTEGGRGAAAAGGVLISGAY